MIYLILLLVSIALIILWQVKRQESIRGLPGGRLIYSDTNQWGIVAEPLYDPVYGISGKPDYLIEKGATIIPVEVKTGHKLQKPYEAHVFQLAAYCFLADHVLNKRPRYGILHYTSQLPSEHSQSERSYKIEYTHALEKRFLDLITTMRIVDNKKNINRSHESLVRCQKCGFQAVCDQSIF